MNDIYLEFVKGPKEGQRVKIQNGFMLGRDPECEIFVNDSSVSKRHAVFEIDGEQLIIKDVGSTNGTFVNGKKVERVALSNGDEIQIGKSIAKINIEGAPVRKIEKKSVEKEEKQDKNLLQKLKNPKLLFSITGILVIILGIFAVIRIKSLKKRQAPINLLYVDYHDVKNRYVAKVPKGWRKKTRGNVYFRKTGAFDSFVASFTGVIDGNGAVFAIDRLEGFSYDTDLKEAVDFTSEKYPRYAAGKRNVLKTSQMEISGYPAIYVESKSFNKKLGEIYYYEAYFFANDYLIVKYNKKKYAIPHKTRYILILMVSSQLAERIKHCFFEMASQFVVSETKLSSNIKSENTRSELFALYQRNIKRAEYLLERTTIDVGNQYRALLNYEKAIWIAVEYENLGGSNKYRLQAIEKAIKLKNNINKKYKAYLFNMRKGFALHNRKMILDSTKKIMELFPDTENYKYIKARRIYNYFKTR